MDVLPRIIRQLIDLSREMSPGQRAASLAVSLVVLLGFGWLVFQNRTADFQAVSFGKVFAAEELASAEQALITGSLIHGAVGRLYRRRCSGGYGCSQVR